MGSLDRNRIALATLRIVISVLLMIHGIARITLGIVDDFGLFFQEFGVPFGGVLAWAITVLEIVGGALLALGWRARMLALYFAAQITAGILLIHGAEGWFVVGAGRNGMEYSVLLIIVLLAIAYTANRDAR